MRVLLALTPKTVLCVVMSTIFFGCVEEGAVKVPDNVGLKVGLNVDAALSPETNKALSDVAASLPKAGELFGKELDPFALKKLVDELLATIKALDETKRTANIQFLEKQLEQERYRLSFLCLTQLSGAGLVARLKPEADVDLTCNLLLQLPEGQSPVTLTSNKHLTSGTPETYPLSSHIQKGGAGKYRLISSVDRVSAGFSTKYELQLGIQVSTNEFIKLQDVGVDGAQLGLGTGSIEFDAVPQMQK